MNKTICDRYAIDYKRGITRCMDDEELYVEMLALFLEDDSFERAEVAYEKRDYTVLFQCSHELKGVSGNASLTELYEADCLLVDYLRDGGKENVDALFAATKAAYFKAKEGVKLALSENLQK